MGVSRRAAHCAGRRGRAGPCGAVAMERWAGRVALVTGASVGIGAAVARALVQHGMKVVGCARSVDKIEVPAPGGRRRHRGTGHWGVGGVPASLPRGCLGCGRLRVPLLPPCSPAPPSAGPTGGGCPARPRRRGAWGGGEGRGGVPGGGSRWRQAAGPGAVSLPLQGGVGRCGAAPGFVPPAGAPRCWGVTWGLLLGAPHCLQPQRRRPGGAEPVGQCQKEVRARCVCCSFSKHPHN